MFIIKNMLLPAVLVLCGIVSFLLLMMTPLFFQPLRSAVFEGDGFIELGSPVIRRKTTVGISFRARSPSGLILYRAPTIAVDDNEVEDEDGDDNHYLVLALVNGKLINLYDVIFVAIEQVHSICEGKLQSLGFL